MMKPLSALLIILSLLSFGCRQPLNKQVEKSSNNNKLASDKTSTTSIIDADVITDSIDIVLGRKRASESERQQAAELLKTVVSVKEIKQARSLRKDKKLLEDIYPKETTIVNVDGQRLFWTAYDRKHFAARHLIDYFDQSDIKEKNSWWPAGTTPEQLDDYLEATLQANKTEIRLPEPGNNGKGFKYFEFKLFSKNSVKTDNSIKVRIGIESDGRVTSFFATSGQNIVSLTESDIRKILEAI